MEATKNNQTKSNEQKEFEKKCSEIIKRVCEKKRKELQM